MKMKILTKIIVTLIIVIISLAGVTIVALFKDNEYMNTYIKFKKFKFYVLRRYIMKDNNRLYCIFSKKNSSLLNHYLYDLNENTLDISNETYLCTSEYGMYYDKIAHSFTMYNDKIYWIYNDYNHNVSYIFIMNLSTKKIYSVNLSQYGIMSASDLYVFDKGIYLFGNKFENAGNETKIMHYLFFFDKMFKNYSITFNLSSHIGINLHAIKDDGKIYMWHSPDGYTEVLILSDDGKLLKHYQLEGYSYWMVKKDSFLILYARVFLDDLSYKMVIYRIDTLTNQIKIINTTEEKTPYDVIYDPNSKEICGFSLKKPSRVTEDASTKIKFYYSKDGLNFSPGLYLEIPGLCEYLGDLSMYQYTFYNNSLYILLYVYDPKIKESAIGILKIEDYPNTLKYIPLLDRLKVYIIPITVILLVILVGYSVYLVNNASPEH